MNQRIGQCGPDVVRDHRRQWRDCLYVYPVISRRSRGLSIGVNLNPDKTCNFNCVYCQIDRSTDRGLSEVNLDTLSGELDQALAEASSGWIWNEAKFAAAPSNLRRLNDIAFSGDGEPTCHPAFDRAVRIAAKTKARHRRRDVKIVVITNASQFHRPQFRRALPVLDANNGEIWAKLDAGTEYLFRRINRPRPGISLKLIMENIISAAREREIVIQSLFFSMRGRRPDARHINAYCGRINQILAAGGKIKLIQVHTVARPPAESYVAPLDDCDLDALAGRIRAACPAVPVEVFYGT